MPFLCIFLVHLILRYMKYFHIFYHCIIFSVVFWHKLIRKFLNDDFQDFNNNGLQRFYDILGEIYSCISIQQQILTV